MSKQLLIQYQNYLEELKQKLYSNYHQDKQILSYMQKLKKAEQLFQQSINFNQNDFETDQNINRSKRFTKFNKFIYLIRDIQKSHYFNTSIVKQNYIKPLQHIINENLEKFSSLIDQLVKIIKELILSLKKFKKYKQFYYDQAELNKLIDLQNTQILDKLENQIINKEEYQQFHKRSLQQIENLKKSKDQYKKQVDIVNMNQEKFSATFKDLLNKIYVSEFNKNNFLNSKMGEFQKQQQQYFHSVSKEDKIDKDYFKTKILKNKYNLETNQIHIQIMKHLQIQIDIEYEFQEIRFVSYQKNKQKKEVDEFIVMENHDELNNKQKRLIQKQVQYFCGEIKDYDNNYDVSIFHNEYAVQQFIDQLSNRLIDELELKQVKFDRFNFIINQIILQLTKSNKKSGQQNYKLLKIMQRIVFDNNVEFFCLFEFIKDFDYWQNIDMWIEVYQEILKEIFQQFKTQQQQPMIYKLKDFLQRNQSKDYLKIIKFKTYQRESMKKLIYYLKNLKVSFVNCKEILTDIAQQYKIDTQIIAQFSDELQDDFIIQKLKTINKYKSKEILFIREINYFKISQFLSKKDFIVLSQLNKQVRDKLMKDKIHYKLMNNFVSLKERINIWKLLLKINTVNNFEYQYKNIPSDYTKMDKLIRIDCKRSFAKEKDFPREDLYQILRCSSYYIKEGYCQGQNYLGGFFIKMTKNKNLSFKLLYQLLEMKMKEIFDKDFITISKYFYVLDNLIKIQNQELSRHLKKINVSSSYFVSSWFITLFTNSFQYNKYSSLAVIIFDIYLIEGIKGMMKCILMILNYYQDKLLKMNFEQTLVEMGKVIQSNIFSINLDNNFNDNSKESYFVRNFKIKYKEMNIKECYIVFFESRYEKLYSKIKIN